jgi:hypothetical protein
LPVRARRKVFEKGLGDLIEIVCMDAADYDYEHRAFDDATCVSASFVWGGYRPATGAMRRATGREGRLGIGEPEWFSDRVPPE